MNYVILNTLDDENKIAHDLDIWVVPKFDRYLGFDAKSIQRNLEENYPVRHAGDHIEWGECQWVEGDNDALKYRGNILKRGKMWLQRTEPRETGFTKYYYTGWQNRVLPATACIEKCSEMKKVWQSYDTFCEEEGYPLANHAIITHYKDGKHSIGRHYDKPKSIQKNSLITIIKTGDCGRPFYLSRIENPDIPIFNQIVEPGTAIIMTLESNLKTMHAVPEVNECGNSGSIVFRSITENVSWENLEKRLNK
jgi:hypothetical protein